MCVVNPVPPFTFVCFNPHPVRGDFSVFVQMIKPVSIHTPAWGRLGLSGESSKTRIVSIHAPIRGDLTIFQFSIPNSHNPSRRHRLTLSTRLQQNRPQPLQFLIAQVNLKSTGVQCRSAKQRLRALVPVHDRTTNDLPFKLNFSGCNVQGDGLSVRKYVFAAAPRFESDRFELRSRHERIERAGIDEESAGPASL